MQGPYRNLYVCSNYHMNKNLNKTNILNWILVFQDFPENTKLNSNNKSKKSLWQFLFLMKASLKLCEILIFLISIRGSGSTEGFCVKVNHHWHLMPLTKIHSKWIIAINRIVSKNYNNITWKNTHKKQTYITTYNTTLKVNINKLFSHYLRTSVYWNNPKNGKGIHRIRNKYICSIKLLSTVLFF